MKTTIARIAVITAASLGLALGVAGTASAADYGHLSGYEGPGNVVGRNAHAKNCHGGPVLLVRNSASEGNDAERASGPYGEGLACVSQAAYDSHPVGSWFNNTAGTKGVVG